MWIQEYEKAPDRVKRVLTSPPVLVPADYDRKKLCVEGSDMGAGASLMQKRQRRDQAPYQLFLNKLNG